MSENGEIYTTGKNFTLPPALTGWTNSTSGKTLWKVKKMAAVCSSKLPLTSYQHTCGNLVAAWKLFRFFLNSTFQFNLLKWLSWTEGWILYKKKKRKIISIEIITNKLLCRKKNRKSTESRYLQIIWAQWQLPRLVSDSCKRGLPQVNTPFSTVKFLPEKIAKTCKKGVLQCSRVYKVRRFRRKNCLAIGVLWEDWRTHVRTSGNSRMANRGSLLCFYLQTKRNRQNEEQ